MAAYLTLLVMNSWAAIISSRNVTRHILFLSSTLVIVGLKYEVGFDWHVYSDQFLLFSTVSFWDFFSIVPVYSVIFGHEPFFVGLAFIGAKTLPSFEVFYFFMYAFFVYSVAYLAKTIRSDYISAFIVIHLFLLFTLEFSTLRQMLAISFFNFGVAFSIERRKLASVAAFVTAPFFQISTILYIFPFLATVVSRRWVKLMIGVALLLTVLINAFGISATVNAIGVFLPPIFLAKAEYYANLREYSVSIAENLFAVVLYVGLLVFALENRKSPYNDVRVLCNFLVLLILIALAGFAINTIRNRVLYEIVIIASLLLYSKNVRMAARYKVFVVSMGAFFFAVSVLKPSSYTYVPYQNYIWHNAWGLESDGLERQDRLFWELRNRSTTSNIW